MKKNILLNKSINDILNYILDTEKLGPYHYRWVICPVSVEYKYKDITDIFKAAEDIEELRNNLYTYLEKSERKLYCTDNTKTVLERDLIRESIKVFKNIIAPINEKRTGVSSLKYLWKIFR